MIKSNSDILNICENFCPVLWEELRIDPHGYLTFCCHSTKGQHIHISEVDNLLDFFNGELYQQTRRLLWEEDRIHPACKSCIDRNNNNISTLRTYRLHDQFDCIITDYNDQKLKNLEINFSNICNQQCVMCNSTFSSKWYIDDKRLEKTKFERSPVKLTYKLSDTDIQKIIDSIDGIGTLNIKGGEPTIDPSFLKFIKGVAGKDRSKSVRLVTNFQNIDDELMEILCQLTDLSLVISIDGTDQLYNWIRGGDYEKVVNNIQEFAKKSIRPRISFTTAFTCYNIHTLCKFIDDIEKLNSSLKANHSSRLSLRLVNHPEYTSPFTLDIEERRHIYDNLINMLGDDNNIVSYKSIKIFNIDDIKSLSTIERFSEKNLHKLWEKEINGIRKYNKPEA